MVMGDDSNKRGRGFKSRRHLLDGQMYFYEKTENKLKRGQDWPIFENYF